MGITTNILHDYFPLTSTFVVHKLLSVFLWNSFVSWIEVGSYKLIEGNSYGNDFTKQLHAQRTGHDESESELANESLRFLQFMETYHLFPVNLLR